VAFGFQCCLVDIGGLLCGLLSVLFFSSIRLLILIELLWVCVVVCFPVSFFVDIGRFVLDFVLMLLVVHWFAVAVVTPLVAAC